MTFEEMLPQVKHNSALQAKRDDWPDGYLITLATLSKDRVDHKAGESLPSPLLVDQEQMAYWPHPEDLLAADWVILP